MNEMVKVERKKPYLKGGGKFMCIDNILQFRMQLVIN